MTHTAKPSTKPEPDAIYRILAEILPLGVLIADTTGTHLYVNEFAARMTGYSIEELMAGIWMVHPEDTNAWDMYQRALRDGTPGSNYETRLVRKDGSVFWVSVSWRPVRDEHGEFIALCTFLADIAEHKQSEEALREAHAELEQAYRLQREFLNNVTHEVRTPLTAVKGYAEMLMDGLAGPVSEEQTALLKKVLTSSDHLLEVVNGVLRIARLRSGRVTVNAKACDPRLVVEKCVSAVLPQALQKGLTINVSSDQCGGTGMYDEERLITVITNLLTNAVKFTESGSIDVLVNCSCSGAEIIVADTGVGIDGAEVQTIFDEFVQLDHHRKHKPAGFGIGLAIVAAMVDAMGTGLIVSSAKGVGTAFTLHAPVLETVSPTQTL